MVEHWRQALNVHLTPELEDLVHARVKSGRYNSPSEVVGDALRLLAHRDELAELKRQELASKISAGMSSLRRGEGIDGDDFFAELAREEAALEAEQSRQ